MLGKVAWTMVIRGQPVGTLTAVNCRRRIVGHDYGYYEIGLTRGLFKTV